MPSRNRNRNRRNNSGNRNRNQGRSDRSQSAATPTPVESTTPSTQSTSSNSSQENKVKRFQFYSLDQMAQRLVLDAKKRDPDSLNQAHKMRMATAYGLERFWGEHLRLQQKEKSNSEFWKETWDALVTVMAKAGFTIPNDVVNVDSVESVEKMSERLWRLDLDVQRVALAVLTQLCDCIVWWKQRHK